MYCLKNISTVYILCHIHLEYLLIPGSIRLLEYLIILNQIGQNSDGMRPIARLLS